MPNCQVPKWHATKRSWPLELTDMSMVRGPGVMYFPTDEEVKNRRILKITGYLEQASRLLYIYGGNASCLVVSF